MNFWISSIQFSWSLLSILYDLEKYCRIWALKVNTSQTKTTIFEKGRPIYLNNAKYLRMYLFRNGNLSRTQKKIAEHSSYALHHLFVILKQAELPVSEKCKLFDTLVRSVLNYGTEIIGTHAAKDIELIHTKCCRWILLVRKSTILAGLYGE